MIIVFSLFIFNTAYSQVTIASQAFHDGNATGGPTDQNDIVVGPTGTANVTTHVGTDDWDYTATTTNGQIRIVNSNVTTPASDLYSLQIINFWNNNGSVAFADQDITLFSDVTFSVTYQGDGTSDNGEDLWLDYSYFVSGAWVDFSVKLIDGTDDAFDTLLFGASGAQANPYVVMVPDVATAFRATVRATGVDGIIGSAGNDFYFIDDVILEGISSIDPPEAYCQNATVLLDAFGNASVTTADIDNGSVVYIDTPILSLDITDFTCADVGSNTVTLTVEDSVGQVETCTATVTVLAYTGALVAPPIADTTTYCSFTSPTPPDITYQFPCVVISPTTTDQTYFDVPGVYTVNWLYYDSATGNSDTAIHNITISALAAPINVVVSNVLVDAATVDWDAQEGITSYEVRYRQVGSVNWINETVATNSIDLTGLSAGADYEVQVSALCNAVNSSFSTSETFTTIGVVYCTPVVSNTNSNQYIERVRFGSLAQNIDNTSGFDNGYGDYTTSVADVNKGSTENIKIDVRRDQNWMQVGFSIWIDYNGNGILSDPGEQVYSQGGTGSAGGTIQGDFLTADFTIPTSAITGTTRMRVAFRNWWHPDDPCDGYWDNNFGEFEDYTVNLLIDASSPQEIDITSGNPIIDGASLADTDTDNGTDFGAYDVFEGSLTKTYTITNNGSLDLDLTGSPIVVITGSVDFTVTQPALSTLATGESTTFTVTYNPSTIAQHLAEISIDNNDADENPYTFVVKGEGIRAFPDTDGDGIPDNVDLDDDNDGISDVVENDTCGLYSYSNQAEVVFLNETFGALGGDRVEIDAFTSDVLTSYAYEDGTGSGPSEGSSLGDGEYTVYHKIANGDGNDQTPNNEVAYWADQYWYLGEDHTPGDTDGRMAIFNADTNPGVFFDATITGVTPGVPIIYGFSALNIDRTDAPNISNRERPEVQIIIYDPNGNLITTASSGLIDPTSPAGDWIEVSASFTTTYSQFRVQLINSQFGGLGNDLAIDDIFVKQLLCDLDGDGIPDIIDLDNDNDGIPNVVELGLPDNDLDATMLNDSINIWVDNNGNGMHDSYENISLLDSDGDGVPDYIDLDSDNDGIFDNLEYFGLGDVDISGDGVGEGSDVDTGIATDEQDGDGLLAIVDLNDDGIGNDHGSYNYPDPIDTDGDGIPNYLDTDSNDATNNPANGTDISETIYANLDADNDGVIDGNTDSDMDGILDAFDTDNTAYGSPRDLDDSYSLFFDGRNDYVEDSNVISNGNATITAWIKSEGDNTLSSNRIVAGQNNFYLVVNDSDSSVTVMLNGSAVLTSTDIVTDAIWVHVAATTNGSQTVLYVNGEVQGSPTGSGGVNNDASNFTIGRLANTDSNYFHGEIDEVRVFDIALTEEEIQRTVYQELEETQNFNQGKIIPKDISANAIGGNLLRYYKMDGYKGNITDNKVTPTIDQITGAKLYNIKDIYLQTAPLPYQTVVDGAWSTTATWLHGDVWDITDEVNNKAWSIVDINNNVDTDTSHTTLGLFVEAGKEFEVNTDAEIKNTWYLELNGFIDLAGESQLVQTNESDLVLGANGKLERDQQGTENLYTYNYFSSPVHSNDINAAVDGNEIYTVGNVMMDGTDPINPVAINFIDGYNGNNATSPIQTARFWLWKYGNLATNYFNWEQVLETGDLKVGEGYSMKGPGAGAVTNEQNYTFSGKPNNGTIILPITADNTYLVGNPYASALDANAFILDNLNLNGRIYLWEHFAGGTHNTLGYQGGYGIYNLSGGVPAVQHDYSTGGNQAGGAESIRIPGRYVPVGQGFFVEGTSTGDIKFENDQRIFVKEAGNDDSIFYRNNNNNATNEDYTIEDLRPKFRFSFISPETYKRQLLLTVDENTTIDYDWGYDAEIDDDNVEDMYWSFANDKFVIQGVNETTVTTVLPLSVKTVNGGIIEIGIDALENIDPTLDIYLKDNDTYHNLRDAAYTVTVVAGVVDNRFEIVFTPGPALLSVEDFQENNDITMFANDGNFIISNPLNKEINTVQVINMLGQIILEEQVESSNSKIEIPLHLQTGAYIFNVTSTQFSITKKVIINSK